VVILADDLGNADLGYRGSAIRTPHLDALAAGGVRLEAFYGQPVCTPARAALLTGRYPIRHGLQTLVIFPSHTYGLPTEERTLPEALREAGYRTAMVGKWHLGHADTKYWPQNRGFDHFYGNVMGEVDYFTHERGGVIDWQRNGTFLQEEGYHTELIGDEAVGLIEAHDPAQPLFLYIAALAPHAPYQAPQEAIDTYRDTFTEPNQRAYAAMVSCLDEQIGRVLAALEAKGMRDNTLILFSSDNGGATSGLFATGARSDEERTSSGGVARGERPPASNGSLRGGKGSPAHPFDGRDMWATLPGRTELFDLEADPDETTNLAAAHPDLVRELEEHLLIYARQMKPAEWIRAQPAFLGAQGETVFDPDFDIDDGGLPHEKAVLPTS
jgi:arylsulfatase A-like enzyme